VIARERDDTLTPVGKHQRDELFGEAGFGDLRPPPADPPPPTRAVLLTRGFRHAVTLLDVSLGRQLPSATVALYTVRPLDPWIGPVTAPRTTSPFKASWTDTVQLLNREVEALQTHEQRRQCWVLQMDVPVGQIRNDGEIYARATPRSPAVRVAFESRHGPLLYATDRFTHWQANVRAIALSLEALRKVDRYGVAGAGEQYRGWTAIDSRPAQMTREQAAEFIAHWAGFAASEASIVQAAVRNDVSAFYRAAAKRAHPDVTGDDGDTMARLNAARDLLLKG
jgi:hypothetical protein